MSEKTMRHRIIRGLKPLDAVAVENSAMPGTPDVAFIGGWVELKWMRTWPIKGGIVRLPHFTPQQRVWLKRHCLRGGKAWLLLQVGHEWMLFDGMTAADIVGKVNRLTLIEKCHSWWTDGLKDQELRECVTTSRRVMPSASLLSGAGLGSPNKRSPKR